MNYDRDMVLSFNVQFVNLTCVFCIIACNHLLGIQEIPFYFQSFPGKNAAGISGLCTFSVCVCRGRHFQLFPLAARVAADVRLQLRCRAGYTTRAISSLAPVTQ